jgi:hypothetical protein
MLRRLVIAICVSAAASAANAEPVFDIFQQLCLHTGGDRAGALAAADAEGWMPIPKPMLDGFSAKNDSTGKITAADGRIRTDKDGMAFLLVARADRIAPGSMAPADICAVGRMPGDAEGVKSAASTYANVPADPALVDEKGSVGFAWRSDGDRHIPLAAKDITSAATSRNASVMIVGGQGRIAMVALAVPAK